MSFRVRRSYLTDIDDLYNLARQAGLLNLPADKKRLLKKLEISEQSFNGELSNSEAEYMFILENTEDQSLIGSALIMAKHGTERVPHNAFQVLKREHFSDDLGIGFIHQTLKIKIDTNGPTEIGGLLLDRNYRNRPEKLGKLISLSRFLYIAQRLDQFEDTILCEFTPPLTDDGRSEFWEALGRRFTGLSYQEADFLSQTNKEFIEALFPKGEIYLCLLDTKARSVLGRIAEETKPAEHLLMSVGFEYIDEVDPFDGGPHYECETKKIKVISQSRKLRIEHFENPSMKETMLLSVLRDMDFFCVACNAEIRDQSVMIPEKYLNLLEVQLGDWVQVAPFNFRK